MFVALVVAAICAPAFADTPDLSIGSKEYPDADAVILRWDRSWDIHNDGSVTRHEHQWVKLLNRRPIRSFGDRTIDFCDGSDELEILAANAHLPDGSVIPVPDYGINLGAAQEVAGWPAYSCWKERIVSFSGIEPGVTLELEYEITTRAGVLPFVSEQILFDDQYPIHEGNVSVTAPEGTTLNMWVKHPGDNPSGKYMDGAGTFKMQYGPRPGVRHEGQTPPEGAEGDRLQFSTAPSAAGWANSWLDAVEHAATTDAHIDAFAKDVTKDATLPREKLSALADALSNRFNYVNAPMARRSRSCRPASEVLATNYGNPLESSAVCLAAVRSLGMSASTAVAADADAWSAKYPVDAAFAAVVVIAKTDEGEVIVHPERGIIENPGNWGRHVVLAPSGSDGLRETYLAARGEKQDNMLQITGAIDIADDGSASGDLRVRMTGGYFDPDNARDADAQKKLVSQVLGGVLDDVTVARHTIETLSADEFCANAQVTLASLPEVGSYRLLRIGDAPTQHTEFALPLGDRDRENVVALAGNAQVRVDVTLNLPESWKAQALPQDYQPIDDEWAAVGQQVTLDGQKLRILRNVRIDSARLTAGDFGRIRDALLRLSSDAARTILFAS
ncbi:MAG: DUF3857 domain-containing protein [Phycisphaerales bacterium]|nr:DUF3857 domain-containing protein [Phycisphaerales bacterium]